jgi:DNA-binding response OmpR family regulator
MGEGTMTGGPGAEGAEAARASRPHVLIVSDDRELQEFLVEGLLFAGFWTSVIASAIQTLEVFRLRSFDLVLVDAALAGLGGVELVGRLRDRAADRGMPRTDVPILLIAGAAGEVTAEEATTAGADGVLVAPLNLDDLAPALHGVVAAWRAAHPGRPWADAAALAGDTASEQS